MKYPPHNRRWLPWGILHYVSLWGYPYCGPLNKTCVDFQARLHACIKGIEVPRMFCFFFFRCVVHVWVLVYHQIGLLQNFHTMIFVFLMLCQCRWVNVYGHWIIWNHLDPCVMEFTPKLATRVATTDQLWPVGTERSSHCHWYLTQRGIGILWVHHPQIFGCESHDMPWFMGERTHSWSLFVWQRCLWLRSEVEICWNHLVSDKYDEDVMQG